MGGFDISGQKSAPPVGTAFQTSQWPGHREKGGVDDRNGHESPSFDFVDSDGDTLNTSKRKLWEVSNAHLDDSVASQQGIHYQGNPDANHQTRNVVGLIQFPRRPP